MAKKATVLLRTAVYNARSGDTATALSLVREAGDWAMERYQANLVAQAAKLWDALGGDPAVSATWRDRCRERRAIRAAWRRW
jgi:hypothetical protein